MADTLFLIDAHAYLYQQYYAISRLTSPSGQPVQAVFGFARLLRKLLRDYRPVYLAVVDDSPGKTFRHEIYPAYKSNRETPPEDFLSQLPIFHRMLELMQIPRYNLPGYEADDLLGTFSRLAADRGIAVTLVTPDKDAQQLLGDRVDIRHFKKNEDIHITAASLKAESRIEPPQVIDVLALAGDASDAIPGVRGIGPKTALQLIQEWQSVENLYEHLDEVKSASVRSKLEAGSEDARLSKKLVTIDRSVPLGLDLEACRARSDLSPAVMAFHEEMGFRSLVPEELRAPGARVSAPAALRQQSMFGGGGEEEAPAALKTLATEHADYRAVTTDAQFEEFFEELKKQPRFAYDTETTSEEPVLARLVGLSFAWEPGRAVYVAVDAPGGQPRCTLETVLRALKPVLESDQVRKVGQNLKYECIVLRRYGIDLRGLDCDTMIASYLLTPGERRHGLDQLAERLLGYQKVRTTDVLGKGKSAKLMNQVAVERVAPYACEDADIALQLAALLEPKLAERSLVGLFRDIEMRLVPVLADMEATGVRIDADHFRRLSERFDADIRHIEKEIHRLAGHEFNVRSTQQLARVLFDELGLPRPRGKRTKTGVSTDSDVLEELSASHPLPRQVLEFRQLEKLKGTYTDALVRMINPETGRIHTSFNQTVTATGRLSSSDPNLQNIPVRTEIGQAIRAGFIPSAPGRRLVSADYSQIELRIVAHCSGDPNLVRAFHEGMDIHTAVAAEVHGVAPEKVEPAMRQGAKAINFGIIYGLGANALARQLGIPVSEARRFIEAYFARYVGVREFIAKTIDQARHDGYVTTLCGRRRLLPELNSARGQERAAAERIAVNTVIQGTAADLIKIAMIRLHDELRQHRPETKLIMQIHDELVLDTPEASAVEVAELVRKTMASAMRLSVPLKVDVGIGNNWRDVH